ncbi:MAG: hypothetical protein Q9227_004612 [Pyrenula ochraceoflavens]
MSATMIHQTTESKKSHKNSLISEDQVARASNGSRELYSYLPSRWIPYAQLIRLAKPAGIVYLYMPCVSGSFFAAALSNKANFDAIPPSAVLEICGKFLIGSMVFRGAACTWNDILDQDIDRRVTRTRNRPLACGAISTRAALAFTSMQAVLGLWLLRSSFPDPCLWYSLPSIVLIGLYPLAKRVAQYPQVVLGFTWAYGFVISFPAVGVDLTSWLLAARVSALLYLSGIAWTIFYDTIYAHQDIMDDKKEGVKSIAIKFEAVPKQFLSFLAALQVSLLLCAGYVAQASFLFFLGCSVASVTLVTTVVCVRLQDPASCAWWFHWGICWLTGGSIVFACVVEYIETL